MYHMSAKAKIRFNQFPILIHICPPPLRKEKKINYRIRMVEMHVLQIKNLSSAVLHYRMSNEMVGGIFDSTNFRRLLVNFGFLLFASGISGISKRIHSIEMNQTFSCINWTRSSLRSEAYIKYV